MRVKYVYGCESVVQIAGSDGGSGILWVCLMPRFSGSVESIVVVRVKVASSWLSVFVWRVTDEGFHDGHLFVVVSQKKYARPQGLSYYLDRSLVLKHRVRKSAGFSADGQ